MEWSARQEQIESELSPDVARFVRHVLRNLEQENVCDAPGVISGVLGQMRVADSDVIRGAVARTERVLKDAFARGRLHQVGA